jgi:ABC-type bacteriocin/lantibiotic exporter with double-glycine peptidase domain
VTGATNFELILFCILFTLHVVLFVTTMFSFRLARKAIEVMNENANMTDQCFNSLQGELNAVKALSIELAAICADYGNFNYDEQSNVLSFQAFKDAQGDGTKH